MWIRICKDPYDGRPPETGFTQSRRMRIGIQEVKSQKIRQKYAEKQTEIIKKTIFKLRFTFYPLDWIRMDTNTDPGSALQPTRIHTTDLNFAIHLFTIFSISRAAVLRFS